jgi:hypothetical protein
MFFDLFYNMVCHLEHVVLMVKDSLHPSGFSPTDVLLVATRAYCQR